MKPTKPANQTAMNVSGNRNVALFFRPFLACLPIGFACCVAPSPDTTSASFHSTEAALMVERVEPVAAGDRPTILVEDIKNVTITRVKDGYAIAADVHTDDSHKIQVSAANPDENEVADIPVSGSVPSPMWWWNYTEGDNGTITIEDQNTTKKITKVRGLGTGNGAFIQIKKINTSDPRLTVRNGGAGGSPVITDFPLAPTTVVPDQNFCKILSVTGVPGHKLRMVFETMKWEIGIEYTSP
jgi:hypothetical protein